MNQQNAVESAIAKAKAKRVRHGKTQKDLKSGAFKRNASNKEARGLWSNGTNKSFPAHTCNGKGNSSKAHKGTHGSKVL